MAINNKDVLNIMPETFYTDTLKPAMDEVLLKCKYDEELLRTVDKAMNTANSAVARKDYHELAESFDVLVSVLNNSGYLNGKLYAKAKESEKEMIAKMLQNISDLLVIIKFTKPEEKEEAKPRERIGYDAKTKENKIKEKEAIESRPRIPNK